ncbi:hypothetical protein [Ralstonia solanacearum]|uniref:hypothetical protein n=1 Tax=Ralstonia solanacearum TaxID=305 RepID=UPI000506161A|nr:hypothetical protein [Ralstonia solanacearum]KFX76724.1 hypothetical protein KR98_23165 [Ralstonia solanacearum]OCQ64865.1 hypothetical protein AR465_10505 [Ralstonia solanacearum]
MGTSQFTSSKQICENLLVEGKRYNVEHSILPSENAVADRLLARGVELTEAYEELHRKLHGHPYALQTFLGIVLSTAAFWSPEKISKARAAREELAKVNQEVASKAVELADLLQQRSDLHDTSGFSSNTHYHVCEAIESAARGNHLFKSYIQGSLEALRTRFDFKYWPTLSEVLRELASDADAAITEATNPLTAAATVASRASLADFFKALFASIEENSIRSYGRLPKDFKATDSTLAILANCALDLSTDESVDGPYVKRLRQRERFGTR